MDGEGVADIKEKTGSLWCQDLDVCEGGCLSWLSACIRITFRTCSLHMSPGHGMASLHRSHSELEKQESRRP